MTTNDSLLDDPKPAENPESAAWRIPPRTLRQCIEQLHSQGNKAVVPSILGAYAAALRSEDRIVRKQVATGLTDLADIYAASEAPALELAIRLAGLQLGVERESEVQELIVAAFVRMAQEALDRHQYRVVLQVFRSLDGVENQRPAFAQSVWPRLGWEERLASFIDEAIGTVPEQPDGLMSLIEVVPRPAAELLIARFNRSAQRPECERVVEVAKAAGAEVAGCLRQALRTGTPTEAVEAIGLLSRLDPPTIEKCLGQSLSDWPRDTQDRALRLLAGGGADERGRLLLSAFDQFDAMLKPLVLDEIGLSGERAATEWLLQVVSGNRRGGCGDFLKLKAVEALGRLHGKQADDGLRHIAESKKLWRWLYPDELRLAAFHALRETAQGWANSFLPHSGFTTNDLKLGPNVGSPNPLWIRQRRYPRVGLAAPIPATATSERETILLQIRRLSLSGGLCNGKNHLLPGTLVSLRIGSGLRSIRAQAFMRDVRAQGLGFEFADMDLEERAKLRRLLCEVSSPRLI